MAETKKNDAEREIRSLQPFEVRAEDDSIKVVGHAAVFEQETNIGDWFREKISRGAFTEAISRDNVPFLINHDGLPLARNKSGTLRLSEDAIGLRIEAELDAQDPDVQRIVPKMKRGDLNKMSFAFRAKRQEWIDGEDGELDLRVIHEAELFDVSIVTSPAFEGTDIGLRSFEKHKEEKKAKEDAEREEKRRNFQAAQRRKMGLKNKADMRERGIPAE